MASAEGLQIKVQNHGVWGDCYGWRIMVGFSSLALGNENRELKIGKE
jgi:hypothetical protein